jgi:hypothetical protein
MNLSMQGSLWDELLKHMNEPEYAGYSLLDELLKPLNEPEYAG